MKPSDFFIGVIDFFSVMLPGALLTYFLKGRFYGQWFGNERLFPEPGSEAAKWVVFLLIAYILGNLIFMLSSFIDYTYDRILRRRFFQSKYDLSFKSARQIREKYISTDTRLRELLSADKLSQAAYLEILSNPNRELFNTFKWTQHFLLFNKPEALADVQRVEADSKFFRSLVVALLIIAIVLLAQREFLLAGVFIVFAILCYYRYGELRFKSTEKAYELIVTYFHQKPEPDVPELSPVKKTQNISDLKHELTADFSAAHRDLILFVTKGISRQPKRLTIALGERGNQTFVSATNDSWYCLQGHGWVRIVGGSEADQTILMPNAIVPIARGQEFSLSNDGDQPVELLTFER